MRLAHKVGVADAAATAMALAVATSALAATATVTGTLAPGTLSLTTVAAPTFSVTLDGTDQTPTYTMPMTATDSRGSGAGWNITITSTQFTTGGGSPNTLATNASSVTGVTSVCAGGTCTNPTNTVTYSFTVPAGTTPPAAVKLFNAALLTGMGKFTVTPTVSVFIPASSFAGTYTSTITLAIVSGP